MTDKTHFNDTGYVKWLVLGVVTIMVLLHDFIMTGINVATIAIAKTYHAQLTAVSSVVSAYLLCLAVTMQSSGALGAKYSNIRIFLLGLVLFTLAAIIAPLAPDLTVLIASRAMQGVGTGLMLPNSVVMVFSLFPPRKKGMAIGIVVSVSGIAMALGPTLGSVLVHYLSWHWLFYWNSVGGALAILLVLYIYTQVPRVPDRPQTKIRVTHHVAYAVGLYLFLVTLPKVNTVGWMSPIFYIPIVFSTLLVIIMLIKQRGITYPLIDFTLFANKPYLAAILADSLLMFTYAAVLFLVNLNLHTTLQFTTAQTGLVFLAMAATYSIASPYVGALYDKIGARELNFIACCGAIIGLLLMSIYVDSLLIIMMGLALIGFAIAVSFSCLTTMSLDVIRKDQASAGSSLFFTLQYIGATLGVAAVSITLSTISKSMIHKYLATEKATLSVKQLFELNRMATGLKGQLTDLSHVWLQRLTELSHRIFTDGYRVAITLCVIAMGLNLFVTISMMRANKR